MHALDRATSVARDTLLERAGSKKNTRIRRPNSDHPTAGHFGRLILPTGKESDGWMIQNQFWIKYWIKGFLRRSVVCV